MLLRLDQACFVSFVVRVATCVQPRVVFERGHSRGSIILSQPDQVEFWTRQCVLYSWVCIF
jgi:hypothetical protein